MSYPRLSLTTVSVVQKNIPCLYWTRHHWTKSSFHAYGDPLSEACRGCTLTFRGLPDFPQSLQFLGSRESMCCSHLHRKQRSGFLMVTGLIQIWRGQTLYLTCSLSERDLWVSRVYECRWSRLGDFEWLSHLTALSWGQNDWSFLRSWPPHCWWSHSSRSIYLLVYYESFPNTLVVLS